MRTFDVFNGDADGICALHQLRLHDPRPETTLITGVKRDIKLLAKLTDIRESEITVLDISLDRNRQDLERLLNQGNHCFYADHHFSGEIPATASLETHIDPSPQTCTALIINQYLHEIYPGWAIVGAFGDNLDEVATEKAAEKGFSEDDTANLREIGILLNYNGYGASLDDLFFPPDQLFREVQKYRDPLDFFHSSGAMKTLRQGYSDDMQQASSATALRENESSRVYQLPGEAWARRVSGVYSNLLAREQSAKAHALLMANADQTLRISVRAPLHHREGADTLCRQFPTGGGRAAAAGINELPPEQLEDFLNSFSTHFHRD